MYSDLSAAINQARQMSMADLLRQRGNIAPPQMAAFERQREAHQQSLQAAQALPEYQALQGFANSIRGRPPTEEEQQQLSGLRAALLNRPEQQLANETAQAIKAAQPMSGPSTQLQESQFQFPQGIMGLYGQRGGMGFGFGGPQMGGYGGFNPMMGGGIGSFYGGFNPMMGGYGGFNPMMGGYGGYGGFNPMMGGYGGGFNPMMGGYYQAPQMMPQQFGSSRSSPFGGGMGGGYGSQGFRPPAPNQTTQGTEGATGNPAGLM